MLPNEAVAVRTTRQSTGTRGPIRSERADGGPGRELRPGRRFMGGGDQ